MSAGDASNFGEITGLSDLDQMERVEVVRGPSSVLYGTRELTITVLGSGFSADSMIEFAGTTYTPSVNPEGTRLEATVATRDLTMGRYAVTVSNGSGVKTTLKKALVVY